MSKTKTKKMSSKLAFEDINEIHDLIGTALLEELSALKRLDPPGAQRAQAVASLAGAIIDLMASEFACLKHIEDAIKFKASLRRD